MVFTVPVRVSGGGRSRRTVLRLAVGTTVGAVTAVSLDGCSLRPPEPDWVSGPDPLTAFHQATLRLAARYDVTITAQPTLASRLGPLYGDHRAHAAALARELALPDGAATGQPTASGSGPSRPPSRPADALAALVAVERVALQAASDACLAAPDWRVPLLGSIAACRASHLEALS